MASTKFVNASYSGPNSLKNAIRYITNPAKTRTELIYTNCGTCDPEEAYQIMMSTKTRFSKNTGRACIQDIISLGPHEGSSEALLELAKSYALQRFGNEFEWVIAIHCNTDNLHAHIIANSVSWVTGQKFQSSKDDLRRMRNVTDKLCLEYGFTVTQKGHHFDGTLIQGEVTSFKRTAYEQLEKSDSWLKSIYLSVNKAANQSLSYDEFTRRLWEEQIKVNQTKSNTTFVDSAGHRVRATRLNKVFHKDFSKATLEQVFTDRRIKQETTPVQVYSVKLNRGYYVSCQNRLIDFAKRSGNYFWIKEDPISQAICIMTVTFDFLKLLMQLISALESTCRLEKQKSFYINRRQADQYKKQFEAGIERVCFKPVKIKRDRDEHEILDIFRDEER